VPLRLSDREAGAVEKALDRNSVTERRGRAQTVGAPYWRPGVFRDPPREARADGAAKRRARSVRGPVQDPTRKGQQ
jgi:hypothetical protein